MYVCMCICIYQYKSILFKKKQMQICMIELQEHFAF